MAVTVGIYEKEDKALEAIRLLREAGAEEDDIRVVVGNREGAPMLASNGNIPIEELYEIQQVRSHDEDDTLPLGVASIGTGYPAGSTTMNPGPVAGVILAGVDSENRLNSEAVLRDIGIPSDAAEQCGKAIESGQFVLVVDVDSEINVQTLLRHAGASEVLKG